MHYIKLGTTGLDVCPIGAYAGLHYPSGEETSYRAIAGAVGKLAAAF